MSRLEEKNVALSAITHELPFQKPNHTCPYVQVTMRPNMGNQALETSPTAITRDNMQKGKTMTQKTQTKIQTKGAKMRIKKTMPLQKIDAIFYS